MSRSPWRNRVVASAMRWRGRSRRSQRLGRPVAQYGHRPQDGMYEVSTWSPTRTLLTPAPAASTTPAPSWPRTTGVGWGMWPWITWRSLWQTPLAPKRTRTSPPRGDKSSRSSISSRWPTFSSTAACVCIGALLRGATLADEDGSVKVADGLAPTACTHLHTSGTRSMLAAREDSPMDRHSVSWAGPIPAVVTPFDAAGRVDEAAFRANVDRLLAAGATGIVAGGCTGEFWALSLPERKALATLAVRTVAGRGAVLVGTGAVTAGEGIDLTRHAPAAGADGALALPPHLVRLPH